MIWKLYSFAASVEGEESDGQPGDQVLQGPEDLIQVPVIFSLILHSNCHIPVQVCEGNDFQRN